jgi:tRNA A-37 threonylcarbamoyl transferase component Bud32
MNTNVVGTNVVGTNVVGTNVVGTAKVGKKPTATLTDADIYYTKENVSLSEYKLHAYVYDLGIVNIPKIIHYNKQTKQMKMAKVGIMNVSDVYGEKAENISKELFAKIRAIIQTLYEHNILYIDITGYNFIENANRVWIIDFEHARYNAKRKNKFVKKFLDGADEWNPEFL